MMEIEVALKKTEDWQPSLIILKKFNMNLKEKDYPLRKFAQLAR